MDEIISASCDLFKVECTIGLIHFLLVFTYTSNDVILREAVIQSILEVLPSSSVPEDSNAKSNWKINRHSHFGDEGISARMVERENGGHTFRCRELSPDGEEEKEKVVVRRFSLGIIAKAIFWLRVQYKG